LKAIMVQGTSSDVGKSVLCTALCRIFNEDGYRVAPFKSQNMALNSYVTQDGREIGRAQGVQAEAARVAATVDMNPILLKPRAEMSCEVIVRGRHYANYDAIAYRRQFLPEALPIVEQSLRNLAQQYDILVIEGAGSPAEINLKDGDIANMKIAELADAPVLLVADIEKGGVFASIIGTLELLEPHERARVSGIIINKFRGRMELLSPGLDWLERKTGIPVLGVIPYTDISVEAEDSLHLASLRLKQGGGPHDLDIAVIRLPHISNFTDFDPLREEPYVRVRFVTTLAELQNPDIVILPGTKSTLDDLQWLRKRGLDTGITAVHAAGGWVVGICGGFQMLGRRLQDDAIESHTVQTVDGLGLLPADTVYHHEKRTVQTHGQIVHEAFPFATGEIAGYEIHLGETMLREGAKPFARLWDGRMDGAARVDGSVWGTYLHGIFHNRAFTRLWLNRRRVWKGLPEVTEAPVDERLAREKNYQALAHHIRQHVDIGAIYRLLSIGPAKIRGGRGE
jgi:adenosylcobyric acid synthase